MKHKLSFWSMALWIAVFTVYVGRVDDVNHRIELLEMTSASASSYFTFSLFADIAIAIFLAAVCTYKMLEWLIYPLANWLWKKGRG